MVDKKVAYTIDGQKYQGVLVYDDSVSAKRPAVLMAPNWMGVTKSAVTKAKELAGSKYVFFVADMYGAKIRPKNGKEAGKAAGVMRLDYTGPAHCDGDLIVHRPKQRVAFLGDLLFSGRFPWIGDGNVAGWIRALDHVLGLDVEVIVPGHGMPVTLAEVASFRDLLQALLDAVGQTYRNGASEDAAAAGVDLVGYEALPRYREWMSWNVRNTYRGLAAS